LLNKAEEIHSGFSDRWDQEVQRLEKAGGPLYGKSIEMRHLYDGLSKALKADGIIAFMMWVFTEDAPVSAAEREACARLDTARHRMAELAHRVYELEQTKRYIDSAGLAEATEDFLAPSAAERAEVVGEKAT
jgi:hypothetical protein